MILDAHTHVFPAEIRRRRSSFCRRDERFRLLYENEKAKMAGVEELIASMDRHGVDRSVICGFPWKDPALCREGNDYLRDCARQYPGRLIPFACLPPGAARSAAAELDRCLAAGFRGVGELAFYGGDMGPRDVKYLSSVLQPLRRVPVPLLLHTSEPVGHSYPGKSPRDLEAIVQVLTALPEARIILAHWGGGLFFYEVMPEIAAAARNAFYDTAASPFLYQPRIYSLAVEIIGPGRILFGSDFPVLSPARYFSELEGIRLPARVRAKITGKNAHTLLELPAL